MSQSWFYRRGGPYGKLAGHDASVNLGRMDLREDLLDRWGVLELTKEQEKELDRWEVKIGGKYRRVGVVLPEGQAEG